MQKQPVHFYKNGPAAFAIRKLCWFEGLGNHITAFENDVPGAAAAGSCDGDGIAFLQVGNGVGVVIIKIALHADNGIFCCFRFLRVT